MDPSLGPQVSEQHFSQSVHKAGGSQGLFHTRPLQRCRQGSQHRGTGTQEDPAQGIQVSAKSRHEHFSQRCTWRHLLFFFCRVPFFRDPALKRYYEGSHIKVKVKITRKISVSRLMKSLKYAHKLFNKPSLSVCHTLGTVPGAVDLAVNKTKTWSDEENEKSYFHIHFHKHSFIYIFSLQRRKIRDIFIYIMSYRTYTNGSIERALCPIS